MDAEHGTVPGYRAHRAARETPCADCAAAWRYAIRDRARGLQPCGTVAAYNRHLCRGLPACPECLEAAAERMRRRNGWGRRPVARCGTVGGYSAHRRRRDPPCDPCRLEWNPHEAKRRRIRAQRRQAAG